MVKQHNDVLFNITEPWLNGEWILQWATRFKLTPCAVSVFHHSRSCQKTQRLTACPCLFFQALSLVFRHNKRCIGLVSFGPLLPP